jgi:pimeloyl-ACP methyl ester carboxylesterase
MFLALAICLLFLSPASAAAIIPAERSAISFSGAENIRLSYQASNGPARAMLSRPQIAARRNGKMIVYLHPTTGLSDRCAPSLVSENSYFNDDGWRRYLQQLLNRGYTILQPDYLGLGTPGRHPFLDLPANMPAIAAAMQQSLLRYPELDGRYLLLGYSQGASIALAAAERSALFPGRMQGTVSVAPAAYLDTQIQAAEFLNTAGGQAALVIYLLQGLGLEQYLSSKAQRIAKQGANLCVLQFVALTINQRLTAAETLRPGSWQSGRRARLLETIARRTAITGPLPSKTLLVSGKYDRTIFPGLVEILAEELQASGADIDYQELDADHFSLPRISWPTVSTFIDRRFRPDVAGGKFTLTLNDGPGAKNER